MENTEYATATDWMDTRPVIALLLGATDQHGNALLLSELDVIKALIERHPIRISELADGIMRKPDGTLSIVHSETVEFEYCENKKLDVSRTWAAALAEQEILDILFIETDITGKLINRAWEYCDVRVTRIDRTPGSRDVTREPIACRVKVTFQLREPGVDKRSGDFKAFAQSQLDQITVLSADPAQNWKMIEIYKNPPLLSTDRLVRSIPGRDTPLDQYRAVSVLVEEKNRQAQRACYGDLVTAVTKAIDDRVLERRGRVRVEDLNNLIVAPILADWREKFQYAFGSRMDEYTVEVVSDDMNELSLKCSTALLALADANSSVQVYKLPPPDPEGSFV